jgi:hypothetical protein
MSAKREMDVIILIMLVNCDTSRSPILPKDQYAMPIWNSGLSILGV